MNPEDFVVGNSYQINCRSKDPDQAFKGIAVYMGEYGDGCYKFTLPYDDVGIGIGIFSAEEVVALIEKPAIVGSLEKIKAGWDLLIAQRSSAAVEGLEGDNTLITEGEKALSRLEEDLKLLGVL